VVGRAEVTIILEPVLQEQSRQGRQRGHTIEVPLLLRSIEFLKGATPTLYPNSVGGRRYSLARHEMWGDR
jgi:hypothetical protein